MAGSRNEGPIPVTAAGSRRGMKGTQIAATKPSSLNSILYLFKHGQTVSGSYPVLPETKPPAFQFETTLCASCLLPRRAQVTNIQ